MLGKGMAVSDAVHRWVAEFNAFPYSMIDKLMEVDVDSWHEVTTPAVGNIVMIAEGGNLLESGEIESYDCETETYIVEVDSGEQIKVNETDFDVEKDSRLPAWGTLWQFGDSCDDYWLKEQNGIRIMSDCGFRIYEHDEWGYFFGIDGAGYDFYSEHWIPAYKKRGLQWHDPATEPTKETIAEMIV